LLFDSVCMAQAYSDDLREKVLGAYASGKGTLRQLAERFEVSYGWVAKIHAAELATGCRGRVRQRRRPSGIDGERVRQLVRAKPDIVLRELREQMLASGQPVSSTQLWRVLKKLGLRLKKSRSTPPSATPKRTSSAAKPSSQVSGRLLRKT
jgi:transposase